ncbi:signal peptide peptidase SppA [Humisphaera borealis]|uniref:Signal peptide peptidase SppA n=1 Tax=Humisphaera borealis TaxID=2807512 RepID=A0A7M2WRM9_9BACT|nr:signal peptide peptidase SppA [Humisphaera borealis]QOV87812.1 signal peptide peptidase SppA [Humisphaera borealis]
MPFFADSFSRHPIPRLCLVLLGLLAGGCGAPSFLVTPVANSNSLDEREVQSGGWGGGKIAIVEVEGMLINARGGGFLAPTENPVSKFAQQLEAAQRDSSVKAVVLRINSPGGTVTASDTMYELLRKFRKDTGKPIVASTQEVAASGGYYVACAADTIVVQPTSVVGSIGVIFESVTFKGTLDKIGVTATSIKSGYLKDIGSPWKLLQDDERGIMQQLVDEYFARFVAVVKQHRRVTESVAGDLNDYKKTSYTGVYSGRVFSGAKAVELGLADQTGLLSDAIDIARKLSKSPKASAVMYSRPYGYGGSIYASSPSPPPPSGVVQLSLPEQAGLLPTGFYYLWRP